MSGEYAIGRLRGGWAIVWQEDGRRRRYSLGTSCRATAETRAREFWTSRKLGNADSIGEIVSAYLATLNGARDEERKRNAWKAAAPFWSGLRLTSIDRHTSAAYMAQRGRSINTMRNELSLIRTATRWAAAGGIIPKAPTIVVPAIPESQVEHLTKAQFRAFLDGCHAPHVRLFAQLAVTTGARCAALLELPWVRVDLDRRLINLRREHHEGLKPRAVVPINDRLFPLLVEAREAALTPFVIESGGRRIESIKTGIRAASARSGVHCTPHMFRHSAAVWMAEDRVPMSEISAFLGHRNTRITERVYARFHPDYLRMAAAALDW